MQIELSRTMLVELLDKIGFTADGSAVARDHREAVLSDRVALDMSSISIVLTEQERPKAKNGISETELVRRVLAGGTADRRAGETPEAFVSRKMAEARGEAPSPSPTAALDEGDETADAMDRLFGVVQVQHITRSQSSEPQDEGDDVADDLDRFYGEVRSNGGAPCSA